MLKFFTFGKKKKNRQQASPQGQVTGSDCATLPISTLALVPGNNNTEMSDEVGVKKRPRRRPRSKSKEERLLKKAVVNHAKAAEKQRHVDRITELAAHIKAHGIPDLRVDARNLRRIAHAEINPYGPEQYIYVCEPSGYTKFCKPDPKTFVTEVVKIDQDVRYVRFLFPWEDGATIIPFPNHVGEYLTIKIVPPEAVQASWNFKTYNISWPTPAMVWYYPVVPFFCPVCY